MTLFLKGYFTYVKDLSNHHENFIDAICKNGNLSAVTVFMIFDPIKLVCLDIKINVIGRELSFPNTRFTDDKFVTFTF